MGVRNFSLHLKTGIVGLTIHIVFPCWSKKKGKKKQQKKKGIYRYTVLPGVSGHSYQVGRSQSFVKTSHGSLCYVSMPWGLQENPKAPIHGFPKI